MFIQNFRHNELLNNCSFSVNEYQGFEYSTILNSVINNHNDNSNQSNKLFYDISSWGKIKTEGMSAEHPLEEKSEMQEQQRQQQQVQNEQSYFNFTPIMDDYNEGIYP